MKSKHAGEIVLPKDDLVPVASVPQLLGSSSLIWNHIQERSGEGNRGGQFIHARPDRDNLGDHEDHWRAGWQ